MSLKVKNYSDVDISKIQFSDPKKTRAGSYLVEMFIKNGTKKENIYIQTPKLKNLNGINLNENRAHVEFEFDSNSPEFYQFFTQLDERCIITAHNNSQKWFKQSFPLDVIDEFHKSSIKPGRNNHFPTIKFKIPVSKKNIKAEFYNYKREKINYDEINENDELVSVIHIIGMKFLKQQFILETQLIQSKVCKKVEEHSSLGYIINDPDSDYENEDYLIPFPDEINEFQFQDDSNLLEDNELQIEQNDNESEGQSLENDPQEDNEEEQLEEQSEQLEEQLEEEESESNEFFLDTKDISEIDIESLEMGQELSIEDKNIIKEELSNISSKKDKLINIRKKKINNIQRQLEIKNKELETLKRDQEIFEDPNYEYHTDDEMLDDEILSYQQS